MTYLKPSATTRFRLLSLPTRVGIPNFSYIRNKRDNDLESTKGNYTTIDGGVADRYFGSETDFGRLLIQNSTYHAFGKNRERKFVLARSTRIGVETPFGRTFMPQPGEECDTPRSGRAVVSASGRALLFRGRKLASRIRIEPGWATRPDNRLSSGWNRVVREQHRTPHSATDPAFFSGQHELCHLPRCRKHLYQWT